MAISVVDQTNMFQYCLNNEYSLKFLAAYSVVVENWGCMNRDLLNSPVETTLV